MKAIFALVYLTLIEARRNRVAAVGIAFAAVLILSTTVILNSTAFSIDRVVTDFGLGVMALLVFGLTSFLSVGLLPREVERRTLFLVLSRSLSRAQFVVGRFLGVFVTVTVVLALMVSFYLLQLVLFKTPITSAVVASIFGLWFEALLLTALGVFLSTVAGQITASISCAGLWFIGHGLADLHYVSSKSESVVFRNVGTVLYHVLPNLDRLDFKVAAAHESVVEASTVFQSGVYAIGYAAALVVAATYVFDRTDFR
jgi:Cu-processing system permease protein